MPPGAIPSPADRHGGGPGVLLHPGFTPQEETCARLLCGVCHAACALGVEKFSLDVLCDFESRFVCSICHSRFRPKLIGAQSQVSGGGYAFASPSFSLR